MADHVVTAIGCGISDPYLVATQPVQQDRLVRIALRDPGYTGVDARTHCRASFHIGDRPMFGGGPSQRKFVQVGFFARFGGAMFVDETVPDGADWAWLAIRPNFLHDTPTVYFEQESKTQFPPRCVMTIEELHDVILEWVSTGERPTRVQWLPVNKFVWELDGAGDILA